MDNPRIVVCVKVVPKPEEVRVNPETRLLDRANARAEINPPDMNALELALSMKDRYGGTVEILSMGPPYFEPTLRVGLAMGAERITLLSDRAFGGADTLATTYTLSQGIRNLGAVDLVICGEESSDGATGQVPQGLAEWLDWPQLTLLTELELNMRSSTARGRRSIHGGYELLEVPLPCVVSVKSACNEPRFMDHRLKAKAAEAERFTVWNAETLSIDPQYTGLAGSPTTVSGLAEASTRERRREQVSGTPQQIAEKLAQLILENI
ncbi:MAG: electron transfer flavoprotein subunit beta/FixA family protein [Anaerolineaceae bacterium]